MPDIVVRLVSAAGRSRITLAPTATFGDFQEEVKKRTGVEPAAQKFALDPAGRQPVAGGAAGSGLAAAGISNGVQLHLVNKEATIAEQILTKVPVAVEPETPVPANPGASGGAAASSGSAAKSSTAVVVKKDGKEVVLAEKKPDPKFEAFDAFLRTRRYDTAALPGSQRYVSGQVKKGGMIKLPPSMSLKQQPYRHVDTLSMINVPEVQNFVGYWHSNLLEMGMQRLAWMYGYYLDDKNYDEGCRAIVEGLYEPPQDMQGEIAQHVDDPAKARVDRVMEACGLECIGWMYTSFGLEEGQLLSPTEVQRIGRLQNEHSTDSHFTKYNLSKFVSCAVRPDASRNGEPSLSPYMVSDQLCAMVRDGILGESTDKTHCTVREPKENELISDFLVEGKPNKKLLTDFFIVRVNDTAPKKHQRMFVHAEFPRENRPQAPQRRADLKSYFRNVNNSEPSWSRFADFHLILYIAQEFDEKTAMGIAECVRDRKEIPEGTMMLLNEMIR